MGARRCLCLFGCSDLEIPGKRLLDDANAKVAELADALDLGSSPARGGGSTPPFRTMTTGKPGGATLWFMTIITVVRW